MRIPLVPLTVLVALTACATLGQPEGSAPDATPETVVAVDTVIRYDTVVVETTSEEAETRAARLQLQLLESEALIAELRRALDGQRQEVVRNMAKLQSQANRAEAASGMAEAELALRALAGTPEGTASDEHGRGTQLLRQATTEFAMENYGGALYLATEARSAAAGGLERLRGLGPGLRQDGEAPFAIPVPLRTVSRSNVRTGPGLDHGIRMTLDAETSVTGLSYTSKWVRIALEDGNEGWIFHTLVRSVDLEGRP